MKQKAEYFITVNYRHIMFLYPFFILFFNLGFYCFCSDIPSVVDEGNASIQKHAPPSNTSEYNSSVGVAKNRLKEAQRIVEAKIEDANLADLEKRARAYPSTLVERFESMSMAEGFNGFSADDLSRMTCEERVEAFQRNENQNDLFKRKQEETAEKELGLFDFSGVGKSENATVTHKAGKVTKEELSKAIQSRSDSQVSFKNHINSACKGKIKR